MTNMPALSWALVNRRPEALVAYQQALKLSPNSEEAEQALAPLSARQ
jgi:cytochrome c-type biogenesis protein CcmH/NrfG